MEPIQRISEEWGTSISVADTDKNSINLGKFEILCRIKDRPFCGKITWTVTELVEDYRYHQLFYNYLIQATWREKNG